MTAKQWEIWLANCAFEDDPSTIKPRPMLILENKVAYILSAKITGACPRSGYWGEYSIVYWAEAGLKKPSTIRLSKQINLLATDLKHKLGDLQAVDILGIQKMLMKFKIE